MRRPSKMTCPLVGDIAPETRLNKVVLPAPIGADYPRDRAPLDPQGAMVNGPHSAEVLHQVVNLKDRRCVRQTASTLWAAGTEVPPVSDISFFRTLVAERCQCLCHDP